MTTSTSDINEIAGLTTWQENRTPPYDPKQDHVAPPAGAWIETLWILNPKRILKVAPPAGAWIETIQRRETRSNSS